MSDVFMNLTHQEEKMWVISRHTCAQVHTDELAGLFKLRLQLHKRFLWIIA